MSNASNLATNSICLDAGPEKKIPALGDGSLLPGSCVGVNESTGKVIATDAGATEEFRGLLEKRYDKTIDEAPADGESCDLIVPQQGKDYVVRMDSGNAPAMEAGSPLEFSATSNGELMEAATLSDHMVARLADDYDGSADFAEVTWGAS